MEKKPQDKEKMTSIFISMTLKDREREREKSKWIFFL
jgi:hypothetical protein